MPKLPRYRGQVSTATIIGITVVVLACLAIIGGSAVFILWNWSDTADEQNQQAAQGPPLKPMGTGGPGGAPAKIGPLPKVGQSVPDIVGFDTDGKSFKLSDYRGKVVVLDFWAGWCGPCMGEVPHNKQIVQKFEGKPFVFLGINLDRGLDAAKKTVESNKINWRSWFDEGNHISRAWGVKTIPATFILDKQGVVRHVGLRGKAIDTAVEALLQEEGDGGVKAE